ncbi:13077_t:CDS:1, partial [Dentiscutata erythropus]
RRQEQQKRTVDDDTSTTPEVNCTKSHIDPKNVALEVAGSKNNKIATSKGLQKLSRK